MVEQWTEHQGAVYLNLQHYSVRDTVEMLNKLQSENIRLQAENEYLKVKIERRNKPLADPAFVQAFVKCAGEATIQMLKAENVLLRKALVEIANGEGAFSRDPLEHAGNCIDSMKQIAETALWKASDAVEPRDRR